VRKLNKNKDKIIGLFGENIGSSLSPDIHNYLANVMGDKYHYFLFDLKANNLKKAVDSIKILNIRGVNVTIPYKKEVIKYLDKVDEKVDKIGAVNTIINEEGILIGKNTDVDGFDEMVYNKGINFADKKVVLIGAGGAARAVIYYLTEQSPKEVNIVNRTLRRTEVLKEVFNDDIENLNIAELGSENSNEKIEEADIIINATPLGMANRFADKSPVKAEQINEKQTLIDLVYNPRITKFLQIGKKKKARIVSGIEMLIFQAVKSFEIWTNSLVEYHVVKELINNL